MYEAHKIESQKIQNKLRSDPNSLSTTMMINPEALGEMSPSLPKEFPKSLVPQEICENQMKVLLECLIDYSFDNVKCEEFQFSYFQCKKWRDALLFKRINEWETQYFSNMGEKDKVDYLDNLKVNKIQYINSYEALETNDRNKRNLLSYDIEQLNWRINYLNKLNSFIDDLKTTNKI